MNYITLNDFPNDRVNNIHHVLDDFFKNDWSFKRNKKSFNPIFDVIEDEKKYVFFSEIPGVSKSNLKVEVSEKTFKISGTKKAPEELNEKTIFFNKFLFGDFEKTFNLPDKINKSNIDASFNDGILKVILPKEKQVELKPKLIKIK